MFEVEICTGKVQFWQRGMGLGEHICLGVNTAQPAEGVLHRTPTIVYCVGGEVP